jgi:hypothetical protein
MAAEVAVKKASDATFPLEAVHAVLRKEFAEAAEESALLHEAWEPVLDSLRMVTIVSTLEGMFDFPLPPEKVIKKGGCKSVDEGLKDTTDNLRRLWNTHHK